MKKYMIPLILSLVLLTGCAALYRLVYNSMNMILLRVINKYVDLNSDQEAALRKNIARHLKWHRQTELGRYVETLTGLRGRVAAGLKEEDIAWLRDRFDKHSASLYNEIADDTADFLLSLDVKQIDRLDKKFGERLSKMEEETGKKKEDQLKESEKSVDRMMDFIYGDLSRRQKDVIALGIRQMDNLDAERLRMLRERQKVFIDLLREKPEKKKIKEHLARSFIKPERYYPDYYREPAARRDRQIEEGFLRFDRELVTPAQREHAVKQIDMLIEVLRDLQKG